MICSGKFFPDFVLANSEHFPHRFVSRETFWMRHPPFLETVEDFYPMVFILTSVLVNRWHHC